MAAVPRPEFRAPGDLQARQGPPPTQTPPPRTTQPTRKPRQGPQRPPAEPDWAWVAKQLAQVADRLEELAALSPEGEPDARQTKALLSAVGRISQHSGVF